MRGLNLFVFVFALALVSCKTQRPVIELDERVPDNDGNLMSAEQASNASAYLKVADLSLPIDAKKYTRIQLTLTPDDKSGLKPYVTNNYERTMKIPIVAGIKYELIVRAYLGGTEIYSNLHCNNSRYFTSKAGSNNYTVPVCAKIEKPYDDEEQEEKVPTTTEGEMIETPSMPGG